jgi:GNAT superfamily N-acetyltransferase
MKIDSLSPATLQAARLSIIHFIHQYGEGRITYLPLQWLEHLQAEAWNEGTFIATALERGEIVATLAIGNYGIEQSFMAVHPDYRRKGVGEALLKSAMEKLPKIYARVACDNTPSLKLCFSCGFVAFHLFLKETTGKPTLWLGSGKWKREEIIE